MPTYVVIDIEWQHLTEKLLLPYKLILVLSTVQQYYNLQIKIKAQIDEHWEYWTLPLKEKFIKEIIVKV
jgi:hypothetical protein